MFAIELGVGVMAESTGLIADSQGPAEDVPRLPGCVRDGPAPQSQDAMMNGLRKGDARRPYRKALLSPYPQSDTNASIDSTNSSLSSRSSIVQ